MNIRLRKWEIKDLYNAVKKSYNITDVLRNLELCITGGNHKTVKKYIGELNIDTSHFDKNACRRRTAAKNARPLSDILIKNSTYKGRYRLKKRLLKSGILNKICYECGQKPLWNNKLLVLQLDHVNGIKNDLRIENLRILCPNCHSQTDNFAGKSSF